MTFAQSNFYFNGGIGAMNYGGDLQEKKFTLKECQPSITMGGTYYLLPNLLGNLNFTYGRVTATDAKNGVRWFYRNLDFTSNIFEAAVTAEYDLYDIRASANPTFDNTEQSTIRYTPYIFAGVGFFNFNPYTHYNGQKVFLNPLKTEAETTPYSLWQLSVPFGVGIKYALTENIIIAGEMNIRKTFTDYMDDVSQFSYVDTTLLLNTNGQLSASLSYRADEIPNGHYAFYAERGNPAKKDKYYTFMIKVIFTFGEGTSLFKYGYGQ
jgi:hypothetical protein